MRGAKAEDYWRGIYKRNYEYYIENISLNGVGGFDRLELTNGIFAICGLNGAGKSTIISSLKDILGLRINNQDIKKINGEIIEAQIMNKGASTRSKNLENERLLDSVTGLEVLYLDYKQSTDILEFLDQDNLDELLEQYDNNVYNKKALEEIGYIVGRDYDQINLIEIEDGEHTIPYFNVKIDALEYNSLSMGIGEHFLFYLYWAFNKIQSSGILLIEEPETFISIYSQTKLMNFIAKKVNQLGLNVILATHSPHIIKNIRKENICIVSRYLNSVTIKRPAIERETLFSLGLEIPKRGCVFVEDYIGELFLKAVTSRNLMHVLRDYNLERLSGESDITKRLQFPFSENFTYKLIGIYDGDMKGQLTKAQLSTLQWQYCFLPTTEAVEIEYKKCVRQNYENLGRILNIPIEQLVSVLSTIDGEDHHDWFLDLARYLGKDVQFLFECVFDIWANIDENKIKLDEFVAQLSEICS